MLNHSNSDNTTQPQVSVVIPCYNSHKYLQQTLQSVTKQTLPLFEIIIVNDGSDDQDTVEFLNGLDQKIYKLITTENRGLPAARNRGISEAKSEFILPLDSDDWIEPKAIELLVNKLLSCPVATFSYSQIILCGSKKGILQKSFNPFEQLFFNQIPYCIMFRKSAWAKMGGYDETMREGYEDWEFNIRLIAAGFTGKIIAEPVFNYRVSQSGMLMSNSIKVHAQLWHFIMKKHSQLYTWSSLFPLWKRCLKLQSTRPTYLYFVWILLFKILPHSLFNRLFKVLRMFRHSNSKAHQI